MKPGSYKDVKNGRDRWGNRCFFILSALGASIGVGNIWKFPHLTYKHGGPAFLIAYALALVFGGIPLAILEYTLGQKMQKGSAGSMRGIVPNLAGVGWVASFCGLVVAIVYNCLLSIVLSYMMNASSEPWKQGTYELPMACQTAEKASTVTAELYLYYNVVGVLNAKTCEPFLDLFDANTFNTSMFIGVVIVWALCFLALVKGTKSIQYVSAVLVPTTWAMLFALMVYYIGMNSEVDGSGMDFYFGAAPFPDTEGGFDSFNTIMIDSYNMVFFSIGCCVGLMYSYGSYNHIKKPVIMDTFIICTLDFLFSIMAGCIVWGAIGFLQRIDNPAVTQTSSVGLAFIAMAVASTEAEGSGWYLVFIIFLLFTGITSAFGFVEAFVTNVIDQTKRPRWQAALGVCILGIVLSLAFTSSAGWILFDMTDHFITDYIVIMVGILECTCVGWLFERETTAMQSLAHRKSLNVLCIMFWAPTILLCFYANFVFPEDKFMGLMLIMVFTIIALCCSKYVSGMPFDSWYHEIVLCGVDKLSMSITSLTHRDGHRSWWMLAFEGYFGFMIKFFNPALLTFILMNNVQSDIDQPFGEDPSARMLAFATIYVIIALLIIIIPLFACHYPEVFGHNVNNQFMADQLYEAKLKMKRKMKKMTKLGVKKGDVELAKLKQTEETEKSVDNQKKAEEWDTNNDDSKIKINKAK